MIFTISKYTGVGRTHTSTSWYLFPTGDTTDITTAIWKLEDSTEYKETLIANLPTPTTTAYTLLARRNMSDSTTMDVKPIELTPANTETVRPLELGYGVETPMLSVVDNKLLQGGNLIIKSSAIRPKGNILKEAVWIIEDDDENVLKIIRNVDNTLTIDTSIVNPNEHTNIIVKVAHKDMENVMSRFGFIEVNLPSITLPILNKFSIDPSIKYVPTFGNNIETPKIINTRVHDMEDNIVYESNTGYISPASLGYGKEYILELQIEVASKPYPIINRYPIKTIGKIDIFDVDPFYTYSSVLPVSYINTATKRFIEEQMYNERLDIVSATNIKVYRGDLDLGNASFSLSKPINLGYLLEVINVNNLSFAISYYDGTNRTVDVFRYKHSLLDAYLFKSFTISSQTVSIAIDNSNERIYYVDANVLKSVDINDDTVTTIDTIPTQVNPGTDNIYLTIPDNNNIYIAGHLDAIIRYETLSKRFDILKNIPASNKSNFSFFTYLKNGDPILFDTSSDTADIYDVKNDKFITQDFTINTRKVFRKRDGTFIISDDANQHVKYI